MSEQVSEQASGGGVARELPPERKSADVVFYYGVRLVPTIPYTLCR